MTSALWFAFFPVVNDIGVNFGIAITKVTDDLRVMVRVLPRS